MQSFPVIDAFRTNIIHCQYMIILHLILIAIVIVFSVMRNIVGWVYIYPAVIHMGRGICRIYMCNKRLSFFTHLIFLSCSNDHPFTAPAVSPSTI